MTIIRIEAKFWRELKAFRVNAHNTRSIYENTRLISKIYCKSRIKYFLKGVTFN